MSQDQIVKLPVPFFDWGEYHGGMDRDVRDGDWFKKSEIIEALDQAGVKYQEAQASISHTPPINLP